MKREAPYFAYQIDEQRYVFSRAAEPVFAWYPPGESPAEKRRAAMKSDWPEVSKGVRSWITRGLRNARNSSEDMWL